MSTPNKHTHRFPRVVNLCSRSPPSHKLAPLQVNNMKPVYMGLVAAGVVCVVVVVVVLALHFTGNLSPNPTGNLSPNPTENLSPNPTPVAEFSTLTTFKITAITDAAGAADLDGFIGTYEQIDLATYDKVTEIDEKVQAVWKKKGSNYWMRYSTLDGKYVKYLSGENNTWLSTDPTTGPAPAVLDALGVWSRVYPITMAVIGPRTVTFAAVTAV